MSQFRPKFALYRAKPDCRESAFLATSLNQAQFSPERDRAVRFGPQSAADNPIRVGGSAPNLAFIASTVVRTRSSSNTLPFASRMQ